MYKSYDQLGLQANENVDIMEVLEIQNSKHLNEIIMSNKIVCVDIYADWCGPCKTTAPDFANIANTYNSQGSCAIVKYNFNKMSQEERSNINGIPVFLFYVNGQKMENYTIIGADIEKVNNTLKLLLNQQSQSIQMNNYQGPVYHRNSIRNMKNSTQYN
jgi:thiol-disulfide isomerase/thioredoxin